MQQLWDTHSSRIEHPPPVPVTHPSVQNLAQSEGMRLAGCSGLSDVMSLSASVTDAIVGFVKGAVMRNGLPQAARSSRTLILLSSGRDVVLRWHATVFRRSSF